MVVDSLSRGYRYAKPSVIHIAALSRASHDFALEMTAPLKQGSNTLKYFISEDIRSFRRALNCPAY